MRFSSPHDTQVYAALSGSRVPEKLGRFPVHGSYKLDDVPLRAHRRPEPGHACQSLPAHFRTWVTLQRMANGNAREEEAVDLVTEIQRKLSNLLGLMYSCTGAIQVHPPRAIRPHLGKAQGGSVWGWSWTLCNLSCSVMLQLRLFEERKRLRGHPLSWETQQQWRRTLYRPHKT